MTNKLTKLTTQSITKILIISITKLFLLLILSLSLNSLYANTYLLYKNDQGSKFYYDLKGNQFYNTSEGFYKHTAYSNSGYIYTLDYGAYQKIPLFPTAPTPQPPRMLKINVIADKAYLNWISGYNTNYYNLYQGQTPFDPDKKPEEQGYIKINNTGLGGIQAKDGFYHLSTQINNLDFNKPYYFLLEAVLNVNYPSTYIALDPISGWVKGAKGEKGDKGDIGEKGENGIDGKNGMNGVNGSDGEDGTNGIDGDSAYQIWLNQGNTGSEEDFLTHLKGDNHWQLSGELLKYKDNLIVNSNSGNTNIKTKLTVGSAFIQSNAELGVQGNAEVTGYIRVGGSDSSCDSANEGAIRYNINIKNIEFCNGTIWSSVINDQNSNASIYGCDDSACQLGSANSYGTSSHTCVLKLDNTVVCWGDNRYGQTDIPIGLNAKQIAGGLAHTCALKLDNTVICWGGSNNYKENTVPIDFKAKQIALGAYHSCALKLDNTVVCWGDNRYGQTDIPADLLAKQITLGGNHACALKLDNTVICWGANGYDYGQIDVPASLIAKQISLGAHHSCALKLDNTVVCWGRSNVPAELNAKQIALGALYSCALKLDNTVVCWGSNSDGQTNVPSDLIAKQITSHYAHVCALKLDNTIVCWGRNDNGESTVPTNLSAGQI